MFENKKMTLRNVIRFYLTRKPFIVAAIICVKVFIALIPFFFVYANSRFIDAAIHVPDTGVRLAISYAGIIVVLLVLQRLSGDIISYCRTVLRSELRPYVEQHIVQQIARLPYSAVEDDQMQDIISRVSSDPEEKLYNILLYCVDVICFFITSASLISVLILNTRGASFLVLAMLVLFGYNAIKSGQRQYQAQVEVSAKKRKAEYYESMLASRDMVNERFLFNYSAPINERFSSEHKEAREIERKAQFRWFVTSSASGYLSILVSIFTIVALIKPVLQGTTSVGVFVSLMTAFVNMTSSITWTLPELLRGLAESTASLKDFSSLTKQENQLCLSDLDINQCHHPIDFESLQFVGVSFKYPNTDEYILKDISFVIEKGKHYAFVGRNGSGKTTVIKLILRLYSPVEGTILLNGRDLATYSMNDVWSVFGALFQDFARYPVSIYDNIALGDLNAYNDAERIEKIASDTLAQQLERLPDGIFTSLGKIDDNSVDLSGGEWQRLAMARIHFNGSPVKILDEPTAALDPMQEHFVYQQFSEVYKNATTILITHRLGSISTADTILLLDEKRVREIGDHQTLMQLNGLYAQMYNTQKGWYV